MAGPRDDDDRPDLDARTQTGDGLSRSLDPEETAADVGARETPGRASHPPQIGKDLGDRYQVVQTIGRGGMGDVYRVYDRVLREHVALKILRENPPDGDAALERFRRELAHARRVTHANVLRVYDIGQLDGRRFMSMQYVDGEDLAKRMRRGRLPLDKVIGIVRQLCDGLAAAHAQGVIHRDLKPQNVLIDKDDRAYIADFGIARSIDDPTVTVEGSLMGSPAYMSPEQVKGQPATAQSDIYALGVLLYQLLTGELPFHGTSTPAMMLQRLNKKPRPMRDLTGEVPRYLERIVGRCLATLPADRYTTVGEMIADLDSRHVAPSKTERLRKRVVVGVAAAAVLGAAAIAFVRFAPPAWRIGKRPTAASSVSAPTTSPALAIDPGAPAPVLVLGIENRTGDPLFDGTLDVVLEYALRRSSRLDPVAGNDLRALASELDPAGAALDEHLGTLLAAKGSRRVVLVRGIVSRATRGFTLSLSARDAASQSVVLSRSRDAETRDDVVALAGEMAFALRGALGEALGANSGDPHATSLSPSLEADHDFTFGLGMVNNAGDPVGAIPTLEHALVKDPTFAKAHYLLGIAYNNTARRDDAAREFELAKKGLDQMGQRDRLQCVADAYEMGTGDFARAIPVYQEILATWPGDPFSETNLMVALIGERRYKEAEDAGERFLVHHPRNPILGVNVAQTCIYTGDFDGARQRCEALASNSSDADAYESMAVADIFLSRRADAVEAFSRYERANPSQGAEDLADWAIAEGRLDDAVQSLQRALSADVAGGVLDNAERKRVLMAEALVRRGDTRAALATVRRLPGRASRLFRAGMVRVEAGDEKGAKEVAANLRRDPTHAGKALAPLFEAEVLRSQGKAAQALPLVRDSLKVDDSWLGHLVLADTLLDAGQPADAVTELKTCLERRGEGTWAFADGEALTIHYVPLATYDLARAEERLGSRDARRDYEAFVAMEPQAQRDRLAEDARRKLMAGKP